MKAVIQAGGKGTRLRPYTLALPKPLMPVGEFPVLEVLLKWLRRWGIQEAYITTGHLGHLIRALCGDGSQWDMEIAYTEEREPMGTVGALSYLREYLTDTFLMLNGDLITDLDLTAFVEFHREKHGSITVACADRKVNVDFGVIDNGMGDRITGFTEKPTLSYKVSMGIYCMEPSILEFIPKGVPFGFDNLMVCMLKQNLPIYIYKHNGLWMDIGNESDFNAVQQSFTREYKELILGC